MTDPEQTMAHPQSFTQYILGSPTVGNRFRGKINESLPKWSYIILDPQPCQKSLWILPKSSLCAYGSNSEQCGDPVHSNRTLSNVLVSPPHLHMGKLRSRGEQWLIQSYTGNLQNPGLLVNSKDERVMQTFRGKEEEMSCRKKQKEKSSERSSLECFSLSCQFPIETQRRCNSICTSKAEVRKS